MSLTILLLRCFETNDPLLELLADNISKEKSKILTENFITKSLSKVNSALLKGTKDPIRFFYTHLKSLEMELDKRFKDDNNYSPFFISNSLESNSTPYKLEKLYN